MDSYTQIHKAMCELLTGMGIPLDDLRKVEISFEAGKVPVVTCTRFLFTETIKGGIEAVKTVKVSGELTFVPKQTVDQEEYKNDDVTTVQDGYYASWKSPTPK